MERIRSFATNKKAQLRIIETILASLIVVAALTFANLYVIAPTSPKYASDELQKLGYNVLQDLYDQDLLARFVYQNEWDNLESALRVTLPRDVYFNLTVYDLDYQKVNDGPILYGSPEAFSSSKNVAAVTYGLTGYPSKVNSTSYQAVYSPRMIILQLSRG